MDPNLAFAKDLENSNPKCSFFFITPHAKLTRTCNLDGEERHKWRVGEESENFADLETYLYQLLHPQ